MVTLCNYCSTKTAQIFNVILKDTKCITRCKKEIIQIHEDHTLSGRQHDGGMDQRQQMPCRGQHELSLSSLYSISNLLHIGS